MQDEVFEQGSQEWLDIRKKSITATDMSTIMGVNPWKTPFQLFEEKLGYRSVEKNDAMREGTRLEPYARAKLQELFQLELNAAVCFHPQFKHHMASLDAIDEKKMFLTEIKCSKKYHELAKAGTVPTHAIAQCQWQMHVTGANGMYYYAFDGLSGILIPVERNNEYIKLCIDRAEEFYQCLKSLEPPALTARDIVQREDPEFLQSALNLKEARAQRKYWEMLEKVAENQLKEMAGESCAEGGGVKITRYFRRGGIDFKEIIEKHCPEVDVEQYRKKGDVSWRIT
jgi:putative phage-type endonuclease